MTRRLVAVAILLLATRLSSLAQPAPVPPEIAAAKKVFIANGGEDSIGKTIFTKSFYDQFYTDVKTWGHFELVNSPSDADMVLQIGMTVFPGAGQVIKGDTVGWNVDPHLKLQIIDPKTHTILWGYTQHVQMAILQGNRDKNLDGAMEVLMGYLKQLTAAPAAKP